MTTPFLLLVSLMITPFCLQGDFCFIAIIHNPKCRDFCKKVTRESKIGTFVPITFTTRHRI